jgi:hypothetical protein
MTPAELRAFVRRSTKAAGVPERVTDASALEAIRAIVATLVSGDGNGTQKPKRTRRAS